MKVFLNRILFFMFMAGVVQAQEIGIGASYVFVDELDDVYGVVGQVKVPVGESLYLAIRGGIYEEVDRSSTLGPVAIEITADYYPVDLGLGWKSFVADSSLAYYVEAGVSYVFVESDIELNGFPTPLEIEDDLGWFATLGLNLGKGALKGFLEAQFRTFTWSVDGGSLPPGSPEPDEVELDHIALNLGILYEW